MHEVREVTIGGKRYQRTLSDGAKNYSPVYCVWAQGKADFSWQPLSDRCKSLIAKIDQACERDIEEEKKYLDKQVAEWEAEINRLAGLVSCATRGRVVYARVSPSGLEGEEMDPAT